MARLIDVDVLLDKLQEIANDFEHPREAVINLDALYDMIVDDIPTVYAWHSQEEIPPQKGIYLVYVYAKMYFIPDHVGDPDHFWMLQLAYYDEKIGWLINEVKWWTELPEPPKEG